MTFVSQNFGAGKGRRIRETLPRVLGIEIGWGVLCFVVMLGFGETAVTLLTNTSDTVVTENAMVSLRCHFFCFPALGILLVLRTAMQAMGRKLFPVISSGFEMVIKLIAGIWLIPGFGYIIACHTEPVIWIVSMVFLWVVFIKIKPLQKNG